MHNIRRIIAKTLVTLSIATCVCTPVQYVGAASYLADGEILLADISSTDTSTQEKFMNLSPTIGSNESEKNITWYSLIEGNAKVEVAKKTENLEFPTEGVATFEATSGASNLTDYYSNQATITGLEANTEYMYRVANQGEYSETYTFKTSTDGAYSFLLAGDPQIGTGGVLNGVDGWKDTLEKASSLFPDASFLLSAGDQVNTASSESEYTGYLTQSVLYSLASATTIGNHDSSSVAYNEHFNLPNEGEYGKTTAGSDYWFTYNDTLFMVINTNNTSTAEHKAFMEEAMALNPDAKWNVVTFHHSIYSVASHATETSIINRREQLVPVFEELGIDVVLMGHDHVYVRSYMMDGLNPVVETENGQPLSSANASDGILYVTVNSASGSKYYDIKNQEFEYAAVKSQERVPNISNVEVTDSTFKITTYRTNDMSIVDEFTIVKDQKETINPKSETITPVSGTTNGSTQLEATVTERYDSLSTNEDGGTTEIVKYNKDNGLYYVVNGTTKQLDIVPFTDSVSTGTSVNIEKQLQKWDSSFVFGDITSVDINTKQDVVVVAVQAAGYNDKGLVAVLDYDGNLLQALEAGAQPDNIVVTPDQDKILVANEGEPRLGYDAGTEDPMGSVTVIDISNGVEKATSVNVTFESYDSKREELVADGVILKKDTAPSLDLEPEYIAVSSDSKYAYVALQENNAIATIDLSENSVTSVKSLGVKDHSVESNAIDLLKDNKIEITTQDVYGIYMPDGIQTYEVNGKVYLITANEGDSREWGTHVNEKEVKINGTKVVTFDQTEYDGLDADKTYIFGGRSFSIFDAETMELVYDSGSDFETITAKEFPEFFNCSNSNVTLDNRSGKKGPEPEDVKIGSIGECTYAFIGLERIGGVMMYDITDPANAYFVNYVNSRDFSDKIAADVSPEGLCFVEGDDKTARLLVANEVSGTVITIDLTQDSTKLPVVTEPTQTPEVTEPTQTPEVPEPTQTPVVAEPTQTPKVQKYTVTLKANGGKVTTTSGKKVTSYSKKVTAGNK